MAAKMSCLTGVDAEDKDADPDINALMFIQEPLRMTSCTDPFSKPLGQQNSVLDVLSSEDMLSPVGLGNGPSIHQPEAHELNSFSNEKEEEKNITPLKTVQEIGGMWDFDIDSPEDSSDNFNSPSDISWDSHKDFMQFLWESHEDSPEEEPKEEVPPAEFPKKRKRKMDMVVMVDPSEELFPLGDPEDQVPVKKVRKPRMSPSRMSPSRKVSKYTNGTAKPIKHILYSSPTSKSQQNSIDNELSPLKGRLSINSCSEKPLHYSCSKCKLVFKKQHQLNYHMKSHTEHLRPFVCKECGKSFRKSGFLVEHMAVHKKNLNAENKRSKDKTQTLYCPQCPFGTNCPNEFVQHAKTHQKEKKKIEFKCEKCSFKTEDEAQLKKHNIMQHTVVSVKKPIENHKTTFSCTICVYKTFSRHVFNKHLMRRHDQTIEEYLAAERSHKQNAQKEKTVPTLKSPLEDAEFTSKMFIKSQILPKKAPSAADSNSISDLFKNSKVMKGPKSQTESKLDKSISVLLSRQKQGRNADDQKKESNGNTSVQTSEIDPYELPESPLSSDHQVPSEKDLDDSDSTMSTTVPAIFKKLPSKRKMSTPFHNTSEEDTRIILPKPLSSPKRQNEEEVDDFEKRDSSPFRDIDNNHIDSIFKRQKQIIYTYSRRMSMRGALQASKKLYDKIKSEEQEQSDPEIKEESIEEDLLIEKDDTTVQHEKSIEDLPETDLERKNCPYCSAIFESGVGLANHIRGHLHRVGLDYKARHQVSAEEIATTEKKPCIRRRIRNTLLLKKKAESQQDTDSETVKTIHSCPLCGDTFDNRTGQSNHIRGHLKRLGKGLIAKHRSPILLLRELMRDKKEFERALEIVERERNPYQYRSPRLSNIQPFTPRYNDFEDDCTDAKPLSPDFSLHNLDSEKSQFETNLDIKNSFSGNSALIGILKKRKCQEDSKPTVSVNSEQCSGSRLASSLPPSILEKDAFKRKTCIHCNASFHSGVSLSNHLRACARRKKNALPDGNTLDCKARRQRLRPGPKKKTLPLPQTPEEMYRLTCRFCDLVFQGPLSVQEDWVKHLQRHIMNTGVPHSGLAMVHVSSVSSHHTNPS